MQCPRLDTGFLSIFSDSGLQETALIWAYGFLGSGSNSNERDKNGLFFLANNCVKFFKVREPFTCGYGTLQKDEKKYKSSAFYLMARPGWIPGFALGPSWV
jgi:hypothetical protein